MAIAPNKANPAADNKASQSAVLRGVLGICLTFSFAAALAASAFACARALALAYVCALSLAAAEMRSALAVSTVSGTAVRIIFVAATTGCLTITGGAGATGSIGGAMKFGAVSTVINKNIIMSGGSDPLDIKSSVAGITFAGNAVDFTNDQTGLSATPLSPVRAANGLLYPASGTAGAPRDLKPFTRDITGPNWFTKPGPVSAPKSRPVKTR